MNMAGEQTEREGERARGMGERGRERWGEREIERERVVTDHGGTESTVNPHVQRLAFHYKGDGADRKSSRHV